MGLQNAHIFVRIEDEFSISVADDEAGSVRTVGDLCQLVLRKTGTDSESLSSRVFYRTRKAIEDTLGMEGRSIHPGTWLEPLLPRETSRTQWREMQKRSGLEFPQLEHPRRWRDSFMLLSMLGAALPVGALWWSLYEIGWLPGIARWVFVIPALIAWVVLVSRINRKLLNATPGLCYEVPCATAEELGDAVLALNLDDLEAAAGGDPSPSKEQVWNRVVEVLRDQLRIPAQEVTPEMPITEDLGVS